MNDKEMQKMQKKTISTLFKNNFDEMAKALPSHLNPERMMRLALTVINRNPKLLECTPASLIGVVMTTNSLGLELSPELGQAYIIPFKNNKQKTTTATLIVGYRGLLNLIRNTIRIFHSEI